MKNKEQLLEDILKLAKQNVAMPELLDFAIMKGEALANFYNADKALVSIGICFMGIKLQEALSQGRQKEHTIMASEFAKEFLKNYDLTKEEIKIITNCIEAHHGTIAFDYIESEICANADCYIFIHPKGVFLYTGLLAKRGKTLEEQINQLKNKLEEKYKILSLKKAQEELGEYYKTFLKLFDEALN